MFLRVMKFIFLKRQFKTDWAGKIVHFALDLSMSELLINL